MKKQIMAGALAAMMTAAMALPTYAADQGPSQGETTLSATVDASYTLTIPLNTNIEFGAESTILEGLKVTGNVRDDQAVYVYASTSPLINQQDNASEIPFSLHKQEETDEYKVEQWYADELRNDKTLLLEVNITKDSWGSAKAGTYEGSILFTAQVDIAAG